MVSILTRAWACAASISLAAAQEPLAPPPVSWEAVVEAAPTERFAPWTDGAPTFLRDLFPTVPDELLESVGALRSDRDAILLLTACWKLEHAEDLVERPQLVRQAADLVGRITDQLGVIHFHLLQVAAQYGEIEELTAWLAQANGTLHTWIDTALRDSAQHAPQREWHRGLASRQARASWIDGDLKQALALCETAHALSTEPGPTTAWAIALRALQGDLQGAQDVLRSSFGSTDAAYAEDLGQWLQRHDPQDPLWCEGLVRRVRAPLPVRENALMRAFESSEDPDLQARLGQLLLKSQSCTRGCDTLVDAYRLGARGNALVITLAVLHKSLPPSLTPAIPAPELVELLKQRSDVAARFAAFNLSMADFTPVEFGSAFASRTSDLLALLKDAPHVPALHTMALASAAVSTDEAAAAEVFAMPIHGELAPNTKATLIEQRANAAVYRCVSHGVDLDEQAIKYLMEALPSIGNRAVLLRGLALAKLISVTPNDAPAAYSKLVDTLEVYAGKDHLLDVWLSDARARSPNHEPMSFEECSEILQALPPGDPRVSALLVMIANSWKQGADPQNDLDTLDNVAAADNLTWFLRVSALLLKAEQLQGDEQEAVWAEARSLLESLGNPHENVRFDLRRHSIAWFRSVHFAMQPEFGEDPTEALELGLNASFQFDFVPIVTVPGAKQLYR